jgi:peptidoglycan/LPS O-acetylase OafA/YrhL
MYLEQVRRFANWRWLQVIAALILVGFCFLPQAKDLPLTYLLFGPIIAASVATLVVAGIAYPRVPRLLSPLKFLGRISYGTYLWNFVIVCWLRGSVDGEGFAVEGVLITLAAGIASWFLLEQPSQRLKKVIIARSERNPTREMTRA